MDESNDPNPCTDPLTTADGYKCPWCNGVYDTDMFTDVKAGKANARPKKDLAAEAENQERNNKGNQDA